MMSLNEQIQQLNAAVIKATEMINRLNEEKQEEYERGYAKGYADGQDQAVTNSAEQEPCDRCVYSTKDGYCQYDDVSETIPPLEPCDNAVSREAVKELIKCGVSTDTYDDVEQVCKWIDALPSVTVRQTEKNCNTCKYSDKPYSEEPCKHCCDDVAEKWESEDKE